MNIIPGDIVIMSDVEFIDGEKDYSRRGRPFLVLLVDKEEEVRISCLPFSSKIQQILLHNRQKQCTICDQLSQPSVIDLSALYEEEITKVIDVADNVGQDFFRIIKAFQEYHLQKECSNKVQQM